MNKFKSKMFFIVAFLCASQIFAETSNTQFLLNRDVSTWKKYRNNRYRYEILYPDKLELRLTGSGAKRDGRTFTIGWEKLASLHGLDVTIHPKKTVSQIAQERNTPDLQELKDGPIEIYFDNRQYFFRWSKVVFNGNDAIKGEYCHTDSGTILFTDFILDQVSFRFKAFLSFDEQIAEKIILSFKYYK